MVSVPAEWWVPGSIISLAFGGDSSLTMTLISNGKVLRIIYYIIYYSIEPIITQKRRKFQGIFTV
jgi:hypothetical protein